MAAVHQKFRITLRFFGGSVLNFIMKFTSAIIFLLAFVLFNHADATTKKRENVVIVMPKPANNRIQYGVEKLAQTLRNASFTVQIISQNELPKAGKLIIVGTANSGLVRKANSTYHLVQNKLPGKEGFSINTFQTGNFLISGTDFSGALYGCLELADRVRSNGKLPQKISITDQPEMVQRGACIGIQKPASVAWPRRLRISIHAGKFPMVL